MDIKILSEKFCDYQVVFKGFAPATIRRYRFVIKHYCKFANITDISGVTKDNVREMFYLGRIKYKWSANTFICYHKTLVVFFRWCQMNNYINFNPTDDLEVPKLNRVLPPKLTRQESMRILETVYNIPYYYKYLRFRNHAIFATFIFTGLRRKELLTLKYTDVDLENLSLFVRQGKGGKDRVIPICYRLAEILKVYLKERVRLKKTCPEFFVSLNHNGPLSDCALRRMTEKVVKASGIKFNTHKLRHSFAVLMLEGGCDIFSLSKMMGHSDIKTTTIYLAATPEHLRSQMTKHPLNDL